MDLKYHLGVIGPYGVVPDDRSTTNSNVELTEKALDYTPSDPNELTNTGDRKLVAIGIQRVLDYPNRVRDVRLDPRWDKIKYWGPR